MTCFQNYNQYCMRVGCSTLMITTMINLKNKVYLWICTPYKVPHKHIIYISTFQWLLHESGAPYFNDHCFKVEPHGTYRWGNMRWGFQEVKCFLRIWLSMFNLKHNFFKVRFNSSQIEIKIGTLILTNWGISSWRSALPADLISSIT